MIALVDPKMRSPGRKPHDRTSDAGHAAAGSPLVSIGLPVYNGERFLGEALDSLVGQTYRNLEILVGDNASTDGTEAICREYAGRDPRIRYLRSDVNRGAAWNFNRLVHEATGKYFRWAAADDALEATGVEMAVQVLEAHPDVVLAYPRTLLVDAEGRPMGEHDDNLNLADDRPSDRYGEFRRRIGMNNVFYGVIRVEALRATGLLGTHPGAGTVLSAELSLHGKFVELPHRLFRRRMHDEAASSRARADMTAFYGGTSGCQYRVLPPDHLDTWKRVLPMFPAILRTPIPIREKLRAAWITLRGMIRSRNRLAAEIFQSGRYRMGRGRHTPGAESRGKAARERFPEESGSQRSGSRGPIREVES